MNNYKTKKKGRNEVPNVVHVTSIGGCERAFEYALNNATKSPYHYTSVRGTMVHEAAKQLLTLEEVVWTYDSLISGEKEEEISKELFSKLLPIAKEFTERFKKWKDETKLLEPDDLHIEEPKVAQYKDAVIMGQPDIYNNKHIVDLKTGKGRMSKGYKMQLAGYDWLLKQNGEKGLRNHYDVFLGNEKKGYIERKLSPKERKDGRTNFLKNLDETIKNRKLIAEGEKESECSFGFHCTFCVFRGICPGI